MWHAGVGGDPVLSYSADVVYQHPLGYLLGLEGLALLRAWAGDDGYDEQFVAARLAEVRRLLDDETLAGYPGVQVERDATGRAYEQWAAKYDDEPRNGLFDLDEPVIEDFLDAVPPGTAVDAACGTGRLASLLAARGHRVIGIDGSVGMLSKARRRGSAAAVVAGDLQHLPLSDDVADVVVCGLALTHVADLAPVFTEFARVLRPLGHLVVSDVHPDLVLLGSVVKAVGPAGQPQLATTHRHTATDVLRAGLSAGFGVRRCEDRPRPEVPERPLLESTDDIGDWLDWPWTLLGLVPEATRAAWDSPAVTIWHFQLG